MASVLPVFVAILACTRIVSGSLYCKDENGKDVDYSIVYKIPKLGNQPAPLNTGFSYAFMLGKPLSGSGKETTTSWTLSDKLVTDKTSLFAQTTASVYTNPNNFTWFLYNDEPPHAYGNYHTN